MSDAIITVENLGKRYRIAHQGQRPRYVALRDVIAQKAKGLFQKLKSGKQKTEINNAEGPNRSPLSQFPLSILPASEDFWALKDVSFEVKRGEVIGIIGRNGAGKSTLLKILSRITEPTEGRVTLRGRVASLLEVGTGFHPELTGRENIFLNGAILGMHRAEIRKRFDEIVAFAEVEKFLDTPVKRYSSGMYVRLAFAVAAHLEPEILIVDEVLAVGDAQFQKKCIGKMEDVANKGGRTVILVSHNMQTIRQLCNRAILFAHGSKISDGNTQHVVPAYLRDASSSRSLTEAARAIAELPADPAFKLVRVDVLQDGNSTTNVVSGKPIVIVIEYTLLQSLEGFHLCIICCDLDETFLFDTLHNGQSTNFPFVNSGRYVSHATIPADFLSGRTYRLRIYSAIHRVRECIPQPSAIEIEIEVTALGIVNRAYPGYATAGRLAPLIPWVTRSV